MLFEKEYLDAIGDFITNDRKHQIEALAPNCELALDAAKQTLEKAEQKFHAQREEEGRLKEERARQAQERYRQRLISALDQHGNLYTSLNERYTLVMDDVAIPGSMYVYDQTQLLCDRSPGLAVPLYHNAALIAIQPQSIGPNEELPPDWKIHIAPGLRNMTPFLQPFKIGFDRADYGLPRAVYIGIALAEAKRQHLIDTNRYLDALSQEDVRILFPDREPQAA